MKYVVLKMWKYASPSIEEFFDSKKDAEEYADILNRQSSYREQETTFKVYETVQ